MREFKLAEIKAALATLGNGSVYAGTSLIKAMCNTLEFARLKHPVFAEGNKEALGVISSEHDELVKAVEHESPIRQMEEAMDVIVTCVRFWNGEHMKKSKASA